MDVINTGKVSLVFNPLVDKKVAFIDKKGDACVCKIIAVSVRLNENDKGVVVSLYNSIGGVIGIETMGDMEKVIVIDDSSEIQNAFKFLMEFKHNDSMIEGFKKTVLGLFESDKQERTNRQ